MLLFICVAKPQNPCPQNGFLLFRSSCRLLPQKAQRLGWAPVIPMQSGLGVPQTVGLSRREKISEQAVPGGRIKSERQSSEGGKVTPVSVQRTDNPHLPAACSQQTGIPPNRKPSHLGSSSHGAGAPIARQKPAVGWGEASVCAWSASWGNDIDPGTLLKVGETDSTKLSSDLYIRLVPPPPKVGWVLE